MAAPPEYHRARSLKLKEDYLREFGGSCVECGCTDLPILQFDHKDPKTKSFTIGQNLNRRREVVLAELQKCQILCVPCHRIKTIIQMGHTPTKGRDVHGTLTSYRYCKCDLCRAAHSNYMRERLRRINPGAKPWRPASETPIKHGTYAGYRKEKYLRIVPCVECLKANTEYARNLRAVRSTDRTKDYESLDGSSSLPPRPII
jgi:hypothetical protein